MILTPDDWDKIQEGNTRDAREYLKRATDARMAVKDGVQREANEIARAQVLATLSLSSAVMGVMSQMSLVKVDHKATVRAYGDHQEIEPLAQAIARAHEAQERYEARKEYLKTHPDERGKIPE